MAIKGTNIITWTQESTAYDLVFEASAGSSERCAQTLIHRFDEIVGCFEQVFTVTEVVTTMRPQQTGLPDPNDSFSPGNAIEQTISNSDGVSGDDIRAAMQDVADQQGGWPFLVNIASKATTAHVFLEQGERDVTQESAEYWVRDRSDAIDRRPDQSVWYISISHETGDYAPPEYEVDAVFDCSVGTFSDIYFNIYENEISRVNGARVSEALAAVKELPGLLMIDHRSENLQVSANILKDLLTGEPGHPDEDLPLWPDADALRRDYRANWAVEHCSLASKGEDSVELECSRPNEMDRDELKARLTAAAKRSDVPLDSGVTVHVACGDLELRGIVEEGGITWKT